jgi:hypothetical protein
MPNLEENLRYTTTHTRRCLDRASPYTASPILDHAALKGRRPIHPTRQEELLYYHLSCDGTHGPTGQAIWRTDQHSIRGTPKVKLGGKNMTFYQRVTAAYQGVCKDWSDTGVSRTACPLMVRRHAPGDRPTWRRKSLQSWD